MIDQVWAVEPDSFRLYLKIVESATPEQIELASIRFTAKQKGADLLTIADDVATINIDGFLSPTGPSPIEMFFGISGTSLAAIREAVAIIEESEDIKKVVLQIDSPGGSVTGTDETFQAIARLAAAKEVVAINNGMIASSAYWIAVASNKIVAASPTAETGSIGVVIVGFDFTDMLESHGIKKVVIVSKNAPDKHADISDEAGIARLQKRIDSIESVFIARVAENRGVSEETVLKNFGKGGVLIAQDTRDNEPDAVSVGMIDNVISPTGQAVSSKTDSSEEINKQNVDGGNVVMTLQEILKDNPACQVEYDAAIQAADVTGAKRVEAAVESRVAKAKPFIESTEYPQAIKTLAIKVVCGESGVDALDAAAASYDAVKEAQATADAAKDTQETPPDAGVAIPGADATTGNIDSEADLEAVADGKPKPEVKKGE